MSKYRKVGCIGYIGKREPMYPIFYSTQSISFGNGTKIIKISEYMGAIPKREPMQIISCQNTKFHTVPLYN